MKLILLAALAVATPVMAQDMPAQTTTPQPTAGGYQPAQPAMVAPVTPGVTPVPIQAPSPDQAYPAPPPLDHYPFCKPGQFDKCMERNSPK